MIILDPCPISADELKRLYLDEKKSMAAIARHLRKGEAKVKRWLIEASVPLRSRHEAQKLAAWHRSTDSISQEKLNGFRAALPDSVKEG
jgi:hypothetical protein